MKAYYKVQRIGLDKMQKIIENHNQKNRLTHVHMKKHAAAAQVLMLLLVLVLAF